MLTVSDYNDVDSAERADKEREPITIDLGVFSLPAERAQADGYTPAERLQWSDARTCYVDSDKPSVCAAIKPRGDCFSHHSD